MPLVRFAPWQFAALNNPFQHFAMYAGIACVRASTRLETSAGPVRIDQLKGGETVYSIDPNGQVVLTKCSAPFVKGQTRLLKVTHEHGEFVAHANHLVCTSRGNWLHVGSLRNRMDILVYRRESLLYASSFFQTSANSPYDYSANTHQYDQQPHFDLNIDPAFVPLPTCVEKYNGVYSLQDDQRALSPKYSHDELFPFRLSNYYFCSQDANRDLREVGLVQDSKFYRSMPANILSAQRFQTLSDCRRINLSPSASRNDYASAYHFFSSKITSIDDLPDSEEYWDIEIPATGNYLAEGAVHHNSGKTFTGSHFVIHHVSHYPEMTGMIGANTYDQLSQATLRELFYWLDHFGFEYVVDRLPPEHWNAKRTLRSYKNVLLIHNRHTEKTTIIFTRVLQDADPLRGIEFSWYWLDETRDTPEYTHDVLLGRMRETPGYIRGIITTTTNGEDWSYKRFVLGGNNKDKIYGSMHVQTIDCVNAGIITQQYYDTLKKSYSPLMAMQELEAQHVNILGGKAYYAATDKNRARVAPWGDSYPTRDRPLVIGCDFNFNPAPCVWMVGQVGPPLWSPDGKTFWGDCIHWFGEISDTNVGTVEMAIKMATSYPDYFYRIYGDVSGGRGTTSNAGKTDYDLIALVLNDIGVQYSIDYFTTDIDVNPKVRSRVENMNRMFRNAIGEIRQTWDPVNCPLFDGDVKMVGWKRQVDTGRGKLDDGGDCTRTHASDGAGYAVYKLFPPISHARMIESVTSTIRSEYGLLMESSQ